METILAQFSSDDWLQLIILILVFGGSALSAIGKKLIEMFSPKEDGFTDAPQTNKPRPAKRAKSRGESAPPVVLPPIDLPTVEIPIELPPVARPAKPERKKRRSKKQPAKPPSPPMPAESPISSGQGKRTMGHLRQLDSTVGDHVDELGSELQDRGSEIDARVDKNLGHLEGTLVESEIHARVRTSGASQRNLNRLSKAEIRRAILLREVLGPPVAMKEYHDLL